MSFEDFARHFTQLDIVHVSPDDWMTEPALHSKQPWRAVLARRRWRSGYNAGGGPGYPETTAMNPQFHIGIPRTSGNKCHVVVSVVQQYETDPEAKGARPLYAIGFAVYEVPHSTSRLTPQLVGQQVNNDSGWLFRSFRGYSSLKFASISTIPHIAYSPNSFQIPLFKRISSIVDKFDER